MVMAQNVTGLMGKKQRILVLTAISSSVCLGLVQGTLSYGNPADAPQEPQEVHHTQSVKHTTQVNHRHETKVASTLEQTFTPAKKQQLEQYIQAVHQRIHDQWEMQGHRAMLVMPLPTGYKSQIRFDVLRDGSIAGVAVVSSNANGKEDQLALDILEEAAPFQAIPEGLALPTIPLTLDMENIQLP